MKAIELFGCAGGIGEGFKRAGLFFDLVFDWSAEACESYETNIGHRPIQMDVLDLVRMVRAGWSPGPLDLLCADPPCTPWSRAGKRQGIADERDMLRPTIELIDALRPRAFLLGNVPGLDDAPNVPTFNALVAPLRRTGYCIDYTRIDAADLGVPQRRVRPWWFGHLRGPCIRWPARTHCDPAEIAPTLPGMQALRPWVTCRDALSHLPPEDLGRPVRLRWKKKDHENHAASSPVAPARTLTRNVNGDGALLANDRHPINDPDAPSFTVCAKDIGGAQCAKVMGWPWDRPSTTVCGGIDKISPANEHAGQFGPNAIVLSERAAAILQGFPESWVFAGKTKTARWSQIGMATPPPMAEAVARCALAQLTAAERGAAS